MVTAALESEVLRHPKPSLVDRSVLDLSPDKLVPPDIYVDRALLRVRGPYGDVCEAGGPSRGRLGRRGRSSSPDSDGDLVAGAKARIRVLEKEAEALEEAYRNYQQRAVHAATSHMLPPRPLSPQWAPVSHRPLSPPRQHIHPKVSRPFSPQHPKVSQRTLSPQRLHHPAPPPPSRTPPPPPPTASISDDSPQLSSPSP